MIKIQTSEIQGVLTPVEVKKGKTTPIALPDSPYGKMFNGTEWMIFESEQEAIDNVPIIEDSEHEKESFTQDDIIKLKALLKT